MKKLIAALVALCPLVASAHEAYVLPRDYFWAQLSGTTSLDAFSALTKADNVRVTLWIAAGVAIVLILNFLLRRTRAGYALHRLPERLSFLGPVFVRVAISASLFFSAWSWSFLGPELPLSGMIWPSVMRAILFAASGMILAGFLTEIAAAAVLAVYVIGFACYGLYLATYLNYLGELIVLVLFGLRVWSIDRAIFGPLRRFPKLRGYETTIVRVCYGLALMYAAITVKVLHPAMTARVVTDWHLTQFHWLFPSDPLLVVLGAGLAEFAIGLFIAIGFEMRITVLVSLFYITLSLLYFRELVWPHLMLYGISLSLLVKPETLTLDHLIFGESRPPGSRKKRPS
jgi:hypothetical protein